MEIRLRFWVSCKELIGMLGVADIFKFPQKTYRVLGSRRNIWCDFHRAYGQGIERCIALSYQENRIGFLDRISRGRPRGAESRNHIQRKSMKQQSLEN